MAKKAITFQEAVMRLHEFWGAQGCVIWNPYNIQVGAGTMNPATTLMVLGPEPWNVGYVEPSIRPDDGRYGDNPNRMQKHHQYQVILKPDPGNPQEVYLQSLEALGIDRREHDIRFVEDNWESPALGAWGLGWEVWLDGQEITQYTYFQQAGGQTLNPVPVELTYGIDRIVLALQRVNSVWDIEWTEGLTYGELLHRAEREHCVYYFEVADVDALTEMYNTYERESDRALSVDPPIVLPAYDYLLKCSHTFNVLDARGAIGVVERAEYFRRMQRMAARIAKAYVGQRKEMGYPMLPPDWAVDPETDVVSVPAAAPPKIRRGTYPATPAPFLLEIGSEELPAADLDSALAQLRDLVPALLEESRLDYDTVTIYGTPRRQVVYVEGLAPKQRAQEIIHRGPPAKVAFDAEGRPTKAAQGFARSLGIEVADLERREVEGGEYVVALVKDEGKPAAEVLSEALPGLIAAIRFEKSMRWNWSGVAYSRPIRWLVALFGEGVVPFVYADTYAGRTTRGTRPLRSPEIELSGAADYFAALAEQGIIVDRDTRQAAIAGQIAALAVQAGGVVKDDRDLLEEVTNLVEQPTALLGRFGEDEAQDAEFLKLPGPVLTTVMRKHQRYFAVEDKRGKLLPYFIAVRNGDEDFLENVVEGNEHVIRARFADARFFYKEDVEHPLSYYLEGLKGLTFQEDLGSYYEKAARLEGLAGRIGGELGIPDEDGALELTIRAARLAKADLTTKMVVEMTSLQGIMGREYALLAGENPLVADAIAEHYMPRSAGGALPQSPAGIAIALADRLDSLVGLFAVGMAPTGSADPFGLRRAALGVVQILLGHQIDLDLRQAIEWAAQGYTGDLGEQFISEDARALALDFVVGRLRVVLRESYRHDVVEAVLAEQGHSPHQAARYAGQLARWAERPDWEEILDAYARCARITRGQEKTFKIRPDRLKEVVEKELYVGYEQTVEALGAAPDVDAFLSAFDRLVAPITAFFAPEAEGGVLVMAEDKSLRHSRLALLQAIVALADGVADFSLMEGF